MPAASVNVVRLEVFSDYLCPWCHLASHRLKQVEAENAGAVTLEWKSYLLRPQPDEGRDLLEFVRYTRGWLRPAAEPDAPLFRVWESTEGPPTHSIPAHVVARAARRHGEQAGRAMHERLLRAYFEESRDISREPTLRALWAELGLPAEAFEACRDPELLRETARDHNEAVELGITGVPTVRVAGADAFVMGAQPLVTYRRWVARLRAQQGAGA
jgi:predicted DsbA family dithiol-disulfide isomerase